MKVIFLVDMESFYASVEKSSRPHVVNDPLIVAGDPKRRGGVVLAACPLAKKNGVKNGERLFEAKQKCPEAIVVPPRMQQYIRIAIEITNILETYTDLIEPFSIDEQFMDVTNSQRLFGDPLAIAQSVQRKIWETTKVRARIGIGENKVLAKMACDHFAKKHHTGIFHLRKDELAHTLWPLPIENLFGVGKRMAAHLRNIGVRTIGQLANVPLKRLKDKWGINGHVLWMTANGYDLSPVTTTSLDEQKGIGHGMTLPKDYVKKEHIKVVLLELCEEVCQRARAANMMGTTVSVAVVGSRTHRAASFHRQCKIYATNKTMELFTAAYKLFTTFWKQNPIRKIYVSLTNLQQTRFVQLNLFERQNDSSEHVGKVMDCIKERYGNTAIMRASSLLPFAQAKERAAKIGGHYK